MTKQSAGILLYRNTQNEWEFFLVHPGGPFFKNKDAGYWTIPKGEYLEKEDPLKAALREFEEETGIALTGNFKELISIKQKGGKTVKAWAIEKNIDTTTIKSNSFIIEWPPKSGKQQSFPEIDKGEWFNIALAKEKMNKEQFQFIEELLSSL
ncbi:NUDIX domain-containing protein [Ferruginibacter albus]|uniref:NUDIX domain-containing protein n=1 Tax=Ferruginibacter albus TaxID=2875540 RepID=UPI001CC63B4A|nr:NUDIX domain-containing protein [Ferruginibacter albus]UAY53061.1 NUDIX domain-containing protein [Ferruginibacter albus]